MNEHIDARILSGGLEGKFPFREPGAQLGRIQTQTTQQTNQPGVHSQTLSRIRSRRKFEHETTLVQRWTGQLCHGVDRLEERLHILGDIFWYHHVSSLQEVAPNLTSMGKQRA